MPPLHHKVKVTGDQHIRVLSLEPGRAALSATDAPVVLEPHHAEELINTLAEACGLTVMILSRPVRDPSFAEVRNAL